MHCLSEETVLRLGRLKTAFFAPHPMDMQALAVAIEELAKSLDNCRKTVAWLKINSDLPRAGRPSPEDPDTRNTASPSPTKADPTTQP